MARMPASAKMATPGNMTMNHAKMIIPWPLPSELLAEVIENISLVIGVAVVTPIVILVVKKTVAASTSAFGVSNASNTVALQAEKPLPQDSRSIMARLILRHPDFTN